jgi:hypothetical protein
VTQIPRVFHFVLLRRVRLHLVHYLCLSSCLRVNKPEAVFLHYRREPHGPWWERIREHITPVALGRRRRRAFVARRYRDPQMLRYRYAHDTDVLRLELLRDHGGVYADLDTLFLRALPDALYEHEFVIGRESDVDGEPSLCNALLMARPGAPFAQRWLDGIDEAFDGRWSNHSTLLPARMLEREPQLAHVEPERSFYPVMWRPPELSALLEKDDPRLLDGAFSVHLWAHLWWARGRRDFSGFHAGMVDPDYVRAGATTYARAAQPFLDHAR